MTAAALLLDYGGVLTASVGRQFRDFEVGLGLEKGTLFRAMAVAYGAGGDDSDIARLERGELPTEQFEVRLAAAFAAAGHHVSAENLIATIFARMTPHGRLWDATRRLRDTGVATALLSNTWGVDGYPHDLLALHFDEVVLSAAVGVRKPDPAIFELTARRLGVDIDGCVFVDDLELNVEAARALGMVGVHHDGDEDRVLAELSAVFGVDVTDATAIGSDPS